MTSGFTQKEIRAFFENYMEGLAANEGDRALTSFKEQHQNAHGSLGNGGQESGLV